MDIKKFLTKTPSSTMVAAAILIAQLPSWGIAGFLQRKADMRAASEEREQRIRHLDLISEHDRTLEQRTDSTLWRLRESLLELTDHSPYASYIRQRSNCMQIELMDCVWESRRIMDATARQKATAACLNEKKRLHDEFCMEISR